MMRTNGYSQAIFGGLLWGDKPVRYIFMDEAGTSALEPVTIVIGVIAHADEHVLSAESLALEALGSVPQKYREGFVFHATQVYGDQKYHDGDWSLTDRLNLLYQMMSVPRKIGMAITLSVCYRGDDDITDDYKNMGLTQPQYDHLVAFNQCICVSDRYIRLFAEPREVATVVAEDIPEMRKFLKYAPRIWREKPFNMPQNHMRRTISDEEAGYIRRYASN